MKRWILTISFLMFTASPAMAEDVIDHAPFDGLLSKYVRKGKVDYNGWEKNKADVAALDAYLGAIGDAKPKGKSRKAKIAFYVNAYNANVIRLVMRSFGTASSSNSVLKVDGFFKKKKFRVAGTSRTLDNLENKLIRPRFKDARTHFVLVCAARSCPILQSRALTEANASKVMRRAARKFIRASTTITDGKVKTSKLFDWYRQDFVDAEGSLTAYLAKYSTKETAAALKALSDDTVSFSEYDWRLNLR